MDGLIQLKDIVVRSQDFEVLRGANVSFPEGKSTVIMGPSGCGKSTLLKVAAGITVPDSGRVYLQEADLFKITGKKLLNFRKRNGFMFQDAALWANKSIFDNLALPLQLHYHELSAGDISRKVHSLLEKMNLADSAQLRPAQLSIGEQKLISFLRAIIVAPEVLFLDDPTPSIDHAMLEKMMEMIKGFKNRGCTIIAVTHNAHLTSMIADYLVVLNEGRVIEAGKFEQVRKSTNREVVATLTEVLSEAASYDTDLLDLLGG